MTFVIGFIVGQFVTVIALALFKFTDGEEAS